MRVMTTVWMTSGFPIGQGCGAMHYAPIMHYARPPLRLQEGLLFIQHRIHCTKDLVTTTIFPIFTQPISNYLVRFLWPIFPRPNFFWPILVMMVDDNYVIYQIFQCTSRSRNTLGRDKEKMLITSGGQGGQGGQGKHHGRFYHFLSYQ